MINKRDKDILLVHMLYIIKEYTVNIVSYLSSWTPIWTGLIQ